MPVPTPFKMTFLPPQREKTREWAEAIAKAVPEATVVVAETDEEALKEIPDTDAVFGTLNQELLAKAGRLKWIAAPAIAPPAGYYFQRLVEHPSIATNFRGIFNEHIAAHILAFVLAFARGFHYYFPRQLRHEYKPERLDTGTVYLPESTALIMGVGGIGAEAAKYLSQLGVTVIGIDGRVEQAPQGISELHRPEALDAQLGRADFVILTIPHTPETEGLFNAERFARMKPSAFFINIGRGMTTKLDDLNAALRNGTIAGAALDVYEIEPLPADHPLWDAPNVMLTPHTAGFGPYLDDRRRDLLVANAKRFAAGEPLVNQVNKALWF
ncbi:MAG: D-2-hydroxyacid dehydrogenase [Chloroflexi bacterium]|nr:D-2-hydroxyacid dehydrogenase [Chloroflexota bacterium]